jgi:hypothetical protein
MGVDIYLQSIWKPFEETFSPPEPAAPIIGVEGLIAHTTKGFDAMRASGGYFRNGYNSGDVMWAMGLTWHGTFSPMLDQAHLPIERARELIAMIEASTANGSRRTSSNTWTMVPNRTIRSSVGVCNGRATLLLLLPANGLSRWGRLTSTSCSSF